MEQGLGLRAQRWKAADESPEIAAAIQTALAIFAHEVRTPLTGILAVSDLLSTSNLSAREKRWVRSIRDAAEHLSGLTTLFVDGARQRSAGIHVRSDRFDLLAFSRALGQGFGGRASAKGLQAIVDIDANVPRFITGDRVRLRSAIENLLDNAVKFTDSGYVALKVFAVPKCDGRALIVFRVADNGIGLSQAEASRLFHPFSQANMKIASRFGGAGIGLSLVRELAQALGGDVTVHPRAGGGSVFTFTTTVGLVEEAEEVERGEPVPKTDRLRILSVEDNPFGRVVLSAILGELGHQVEFASRAEDALVRLTQDDFDAVLMDMVLPGMSGIDAIRTLRALDHPAAKLPVFGISGRGDDEAGALAAGATAFFIKPVSPRSLATALSEATHPPAD